MQFNVNTDAVNKQRVLLEKYSKNAFPRAVKNTLNSAALDVKQNTMLKQSKKSFKGQRDKNFFKSQSRVNFAKGSNVNSMQSEVGFVPHASRPGSKAAIADLKEQEEGGNIKRPLMGTSGIRVGKSYAKKVKQEFTLNKLQAEGIIDKSGNINKSKVISANDVSKRNEKGRSRKLGSKKQRFIRASFAAVKHTKGYVLGNKTAGNKQTLSRIDSISSNGKKVTVERVALYSFLRGRAVKINSTHFMEKASLTTHSKMENFFTRHANAALKFYAK